MATLKPPAQYRVVIFDAIDEPGRLRDGVSEAAAVHPTDAVLWLARAPGTWPTPVSEEVARRLLDYLYKSGVAAEAWRVDLYPELNPVRTIHRAACLPEGFRVEGLRGEPTHYVPWDRIELVCAGRIGGEDQFRDAQPPRWPSTVVSGIRALALMKPRPSYRSARASRVPRDPAGEVVIIRRDPRIAFRIVESQMNYAYLGDRRRDSATENFPLFLADLCARSQAAYITDSTRSLLEKPDANDHLFAGSQELFEHAALRLLWSWYRRDRDAHDPNLGTNPDQEAPT